MLVLEALILIGLIGITCAIIWGRDLMSLVIIYCMFSFATMFLYILMGAPDVAFTEAVIGVISTIYFIIILRSVNRKSKRADEATVWTSKRQRNYDIKKIIIAVIVLVVFTAPVIAVKGILPGIGDPSSAAATHVSSYYIENTEAISNSPNMVTSVIVDFRAFDTLFETTVMFLAGVSVLLILSSSTRKRRVSLGTVVQVRSKGKAAVFNTVNKEVIISIIEPLMLIYAIYVLFHGEVSLGGGFQAGALIAMVYLLDVMVAKRERNIFLFTFTKYRAAAAAGLGPFIYALCGVLTMAGGGLFLEYGKLPLPVDELELHSIGILMVEIGVTIGVACTIIAILNAILERTEFDDDDNK